MNIEVFSTIFIILFTLIGFLFPIIFVFAILKITTTIMKKANNAKYFRNNIVNFTNGYRPEQKYIDIDTNKLSEFNVSDLAAFKNYFVNIFINFKKACNNLDYELMQSVTTNQIYQNYKTGIDLDLKDGNKKVLDDINVNKIVIYDLKSSDTNQTVYTMIEVSYFSYTIGKNNTVVKGDRTKKITEKYEVDFKKTFITEEKTNCPNCGSILKEGICQYCKTSIHNVQFEISSIKKIIE